MMAERATVQELLVLFGLALETTRSSNMVPYLLAAATTRLSAADPARTAVPRPRYLFQTTTMGAAIPKLEYVPTTTPTTMAKEKARSTWPPMRKSTRTVRNVNPLVNIVRESV